MLKINLKKIKYVQALKGLFLIVSLTCSSLQADDSQLPALRIFDDSLPSSSLHTVNINSSSAALTAENGELLRSVPGVDAGRFGGYGLEPVIRGQQQSQLQITTMGTYAHGACPNRMDPPSSISQANLFDTLVVSKGYQTVIRGPGGSGGAILFERSIPQRVLAGDLGTSYLFNGDTTNSHVDLSHRMNNLFARTSAQLVDAGNYKDGDSNTVRSSYREYSGIVDFGLVDDEDDYVRLSMHAGKTEDVLFPGAGMDTPKSDLVAPRLDGKITPHALMLNKVEFSLYAALVDHLMDNYSLRDPTSMLMNTASTSDTVGGRIAGNVSLQDDITLDVGIDVLFLNQSAERFSGKDPQSVNVLSSIVWPDISQQDIGLFAQATKEISESNKITGGARLDRVSNEADAVDQSYGMMQVTPQMLYRSYYGETLQTETDYNPSALLNHEYQLSQSVSTSIGINYVSRNANPTELAIASDGMSGRWVGNPTLDPEKHRQMHLGAQWVGDGVGFSGTAFVNSVSDYIFRDVARGQDGILKDDGSSVYRNISALLSGVEVAGDVSLRENVTLESSLNYTYGRNRSDNIALAQIPPLSGRTTIKYLDELFMVSLTSRYAARQSRVDDDVLFGSGRDMSETAGYILFDIDGSIAITPELRLTAGIHNVGDASYSNHLNRSDAFNPIEVRINEPGISGFVGVSWDI